MVYSRELEFIELGSFPIEFAPDIEAGCANYFIFIFSKILGQYKNYFTDGSLGSSYNGIDFPELDTGMDMYYDKSSEKACFIATNGSVDFI